MREKKIEQKLVTAVKKHGGICQTVYCFYRMAGLPLWKSKHQIRNQDLYSFQGTDF